MRLTRKQRVLGTVLLLAGLVLGADRFFGSGRPAPLQAAQAGPAAPASTAADAQAFSDSLARLSRGEYVSVADRIDQLQRDLFEPTAVMETAFTPVETDLPPEPAAAAAQAAASEADFQSSHHLEGVLLGHTPMAVIDSRVLAVNSDLDGYTLVEVQRDRVIFQKLATGARVVLELSPSPKTP
jgi:hypothetical protein